MNIRTDMNLGRMNQIQMKLKKGFNLNPSAMGRKWPRGLARSAKAAYQGPGLNRPHSPVPQ
jgi:hypothetical protein